MAEFSIGTLEELCEKICMPEEVTEAVITLDKQFAVQLPNSYTDMLFYPPAWSEGLIQIQRWLGDDLHGFKMLACMLRCCLKTQEVYQAHQISEEIYIDTMKCFSRFVREYKEFYGRYGFDGESWTVRHISGRLFQIGAMEYELIDETNSRYIAFHMPSDIRLEEQRLLHSFFQARDFFQEKFPEYGPIATRGATAWNFSPTLKKLLPKDSNTLMYQKFYIIDRISAPCSYKRWIFKRDDIPLDELPENTSLQRNLKRYLQSGGTVINAAGYLKRTVFDTPSIWNGRYVKDYFLDRFDKAKRISRRALVWIGKCVFHPLPARAFLQTTSRGIIAKACLCKKKMVALTFDDGDQFSPELLDKLNQHGVKATFFINGVQLLEHQALWQQALDTGHEIGNHSYDHFRLTLLPEKDIFRQLSKTQQILKDLFGQDNKLFRPPYGNWNSYIGKISRTLGLVCVCWSVDSSDWTGIGAEEIYERVIKSNQLENGAIILFHTHGAHTIEALDLILPTLKELGYDVVPVSELLNTISLYRRRLRQIRPLATK